MGSLYSDKNEGQAFPERKSRFEETRAGEDSRIRGAEASLRSAMSELEEVKFEPLSLNSKLKKTGFSGYRRSSVEAYVDELKRTANQLKDSMQQQIQSLSAECMRLKSESQVLRGQITEAEEQTTQVRQLLAEVTSERDAAEQKASEANAELRTMEDRVSLYEAESPGTEELQVLLQEKTDELLGMAAENERLREQIEDFSAKINSINDEFISYKNAKAAESGEIDRLKQQADSLQEDNDTLRSELEKARQELSERVRQEPEDVKKRFYEENIELMRKFSDLYEEYKKEIARGDSLAEEKEALNALLEEYRKRERANAGLRKINEEQREAVEQMQAVINGLLDEVQHQQEAYERLSAERGENKELLYSLSRESSSLHTQNVELLDTNEELRIQNEELSERVAKLEAENAKLSQPPAPPPSSTVISLFQPEQNDGDSDASGDPFSETMKKIRNIKSYNA